MLAGRRFFGGVELVGRGDALRRRVPLRLKAAGAEGVGMVHEIPPCVLAMLERYIRRRDLSQNYALSFYFITDL